MLLSSCTERERIIPTKPFIVIDMMPYNIGIYNIKIKYTAKDKDGYVFCFDKEYDDVGLAYLVGDTIR
jgi:hypothetical protein